MYRVISYYFFLRTNDSFMNKHSNLHPCIKCSKKEMKKRAKKKKRKMWRRIHAIKGVQRDREEVKYVLVGVAQRAESGKMVKDRCALSDSHIY